MNCNVVLRAWCNNFFLFFIFYFLCLCLYFGCDLRPVKTLDGGHVSKSGHVSTIQRVWWKFPLDTSRVPLFFCSIVYFVCLFVILICLFICIFVYIHTLNGKLIQSFIMIFFLVVLPPNTKFWLHPSTSRIAIMKVHVQYLKYCKHILALLDYEIYHFEYVVLRTQYNRLQIIDQNKSD